MSHLQKSTKAGVSREVMCMHYLLSLFTAALSEHFFKNDALDEHAMLTMGRVMHKGFQSDFGSSVSSASTKPHVADACHSVTACRNALSYFQLVVNADVPECARSLLNKYVIGSLATDDAVVGNLLSVVVDRKIKGLKSWSYNGLSKHIIDVLPGLLKNALEGSDSVFQSGTLIHEFTQQVSYKDRISPLVSDVFEEIGDDIEAYWHALTLHS